MRYIYNMNAFRKFLSAAWEILEVVFIAVVTVFIIRSFLVQPFLVSGASMEPNFKDGNYLLVDEITYRFREPLRGEVVIFRYPLDPSTFFIKRIIGLPGERVVSQNGQIRIFSDGQEIFLDEEYLLSRSVDNFDSKLGEDKYFVLGDNRNHSFDSRNWGAVSRKDIVGMARLRILPLRDFGLFEAPSY